MKVAVQALKCVWERATVSGIATAPAAAYEPSADARTDAQIVDWILENGNLIYHPTSSCKYW